MNDVRVIILCKAPVPGRVKTRLIPAFSAPEATRLHAAMAETVIDRARSLFADVHLAADVCNHPFFARFELPVVAQGPGGLGERLARLCTAAFAESGRPVLFLGTDSPHMPVQRLTSAAKLLRSHDVVIGPVEDGGYDLIACRSCWPGIFERIRWSSAHVLDDTLARINTLGLSRALLDTSFDVDRADDVARAKSNGWVDATA
jgi:uncharacterized protein